MERYEPKNILGGALSGRLAVERRYSSLAKHYNPDNTLVTSVMKNLERNHALALLEGSKMQNTLASFRKHYEPKDILGGVFSEKLAVERCYSSLAKHYNPDNTLVTSVMKNLEKNLALLESSKVQNTLASFRKRGSSHTSCQNVLWGAMHNRRESPVKRIRQKSKYARTSPEIPRLISREMEVVRDVLIACYQNILKGTEDEDVIVHYRYFIEDAIKCYKQGIYPGAITALWKAAVCLLYEYVLFRYPREFNDVAREKVRKWKKAKTIDDLGKMQDFVFLDCLEAISVISPTGKKQLIRCLHLRNIHSHPNSAEITPLGIAEYFETLLTNVFDQFQYTEGPEITVH